MNKKTEDTWPPKEMTEQARQQARLVRDAAREGGMRFQAYLPPELALWLLDRIEQGMFVDPSEAVFVLLDEARELEVHLDLRKELFKRRILRAADDPRPGIPADEFMAEFEAMRKKPRPATWHPIKGA